jgi:hypothetical protein
MLAFLVEAKHLVKTAVAEQDLADQHRPQDQEDSHQEFVAFLEFWDFNRAGWRSHVPPQDFFANIA